MKFGNPFKGLLRKDSAIGRALGLMNMGRPKWTPRRYDQLAEEAYQKNAIGYACVRLIAQAAAAIPFDVKVDGDEVDEHPVVSLMKRPNRTQTGRDLLEAFYSYYMLAGNSYVEAVSLRPEDVDELYCLRPDRTTAVPGARGWPVAYEYKVNGSTVTFDVNVGRKQSPLMHFKSFHPLNDYYGMSPVEAAAYAIDIHNEAGAYDKALLQNSARPSGALSTEKDLGEEQYGRLKSELDKKTNDAAENRKPLLLEGGLKWVPFSLSPQEMDFIESKREKAREIALAFGVPPMLLGIPGDNTYANYSEANRAFYRQVVMPLAEKGLAAFALFLSPTYGEGLEIVPNFDDLPALAEERKLLWDRLNAAKFISLDEKRDAAGYDDYKGDPEKPATQVFVSSSEVPIDMAGFEPGGEEPTDPNADPAVDPNADPVTDPNADPEDEPVDPPQE